VDCSQEVACGLVVACCDSAILLEPGEEVLDQVTLLVEVAVKCGWVLAVRARWNDRLLASLGQWLAHAFVSIERLIRDQPIRRDVRQEMIRADQVVRLAAGQMKPDRVAQRIGQGMDLGAQSAAGSSDGLVLVGFFFAPALC